FALSIERTKHISPSFVAETLNANLGNLSSYPKTLGIAALRDAITQGCAARFRVPSGWLDPARHVLPVSGTREALFSFVRAILDRERGGLVMSPNPFYQIYEGAALLAGATPHYLPCLAQNNFIPALDAVTPDTW